MVAQTDMDQIQADLVNDFNNNKELTLNVDD